MGNGHFAFTADVTGLQTLNATYREPPLQTMTHHDWAWHTVPAALAGVQPRAFKEQRVVVNGHTSFYDTSCEGQQALCDYLRANPHRINLMRLFLTQGPNAPVIASSDIDSISQTLELWTGMLLSNFSLHAAPVSVQTSVHPEMDQVSVRVCSPLVASGELGLGIAFPYADTSFGGGSDWSMPARHSSKRLDPPAPCDTVPVLWHQLDNTSYAVKLRLNMSSSPSSRQGSCVSLFADERVPHLWFAMPTPTRTAADADLAASSCFELSALVAPLEPSATLPTTVADAFAASAEQWAAYWKSGAALDLAGSTAAGASELERRAVLSQYIFASQEAASNPPQETGLMVNSWYGKFHLEMRWHHAAHYFLWGRGHLAQRADGYFDRVRPLARAHTTQKQGFDGVRWPKMVGPPEAMKFADGFTLYTGPSGAGPWLLWQQVHPLAFAEMAYRAAAAQPSPPPSAAQLHREVPTPEAVVLKRYNETVHDTATFMADFVLHSPFEEDIRGGGLGHGRGGGSSRCRSLGPPVFTAEIESNEGRPATESRDPTFEQIYWRFGLELALRWRARLKLPVEPRWRQALDELCTPAPRHYSDAAGTTAVFYPYANSTVLAPGKYATQLFGAILAPVGLANATVMAETLHQALNEIHTPGQGWLLPWCSNYAMYAMAAARLGDPRLAAELLVLPAASGRDGSAEYLANGQCRMEGFLPVYTPGNGALLSAIAMVVAGWDGDDGEPLPGLPRDGSWRVQAEGFAKAM